jgi:hypothetical protein
MNTRTNPKSTTVLLGHFQLLDIDSAAIFNPGMSLHAGQGSAKVVIGGDELRFDDPAQAATISAIVELIQQKGYKIPVN